jgi:hypothetical protein
MNLIGELTYTNKQHNISNINDLIKNNSSPSGIIETIQTDAFKAVKIKTRAHDLCILSDNLLLVAGFEDEHLAIYDQDFNMIEKIDKINNQTFKPYAIIINDNNCYILDWEKHCILMTDLNFKFIKSNGSKGSTIDKFCYPYSIAIKNDILYVSDNDNKRIKLYTTDLQFIQSFSLDYMPCLIKISNNKICVISEKEIFIYGLNQFNLVKKLEMKIHRISELSSFIYGFDLMKKRLIIIDFDGNLVEEIKIDRFKEYITGAKDCALILFKARLLMAFREKGIIGCFDIKS